MKNTHWANIREPGPLLSFAYNETTPAVHAYATGAGVIQRPRQNRALVINGIGDSGDNCLDSVFDSKN